MSIAETLEIWYNINSRKLPWRESVSAYHIWLSEIILQQTRVNQGLAYYNRFVERFPDIRALSAAPVDEVLRLWQGLGYYTRARNMHQTAQMIVNKYQGEFPVTYDALLKLKGIGPYTAAAIASIAFNEPVALVDGNVFRVISRLYGIDTPIDTPKGKVVFMQHAQDLLNTDNPGLHNQAMMELGALVCLPRNPRCTECPLVSHCKALKHNTISLLPRKSGKTSMRERFFHYLFINHNGFTYIKRRENKDIWKLLYEFPLIETDRETDFDQLRQTTFWKEFFAKTDERVEPQVQYFRHQLTHQTLHCRFYTIHTASEPALDKHPYLAVKIAEISRYAIPRVIDRFLGNLQHERLL
ncbi:MAG: A/G-specific adenine glycosylase [Bacteroidales bacterium]|nr:A/G-specific adenine glycosylase [Bacteroidales bacterium]